ncbi:MAG: hypothetical protein ACKPKO_15765, partial [Candidatus Fonsibacter sp.]
MNCVVDVEHDDGKGRGGLALLGRIRLAGLVGWHTYVALEAMFADRALIVIGHATTTTTTTAATTTTFEGVAMCMNSSYWVIPPLPVCW